MLPVKIKTGIKVGVAVAVVAGAAIAGWQVRDWQSESSELARLEADRKATGLLIELAEEVASRTEVAIGAIRVENKTIHQKAVHEVQTNTIYADCRLPDSGRMRANEARQAANAAISAVPAAADVP